MQNGEYVPPEDPSTECCSVCREAQCTVGDMDYTLGACQPRECMENGEWAQMIIDCAENFESSARTANTPRQRILMHAACVERFPNQTQAVLRKPSNLHSSAQFVLWLLLQQQVSFCT